MSDKILVYEDNKKENIPFLYTPKGLSYEDFLRHMYRTLHGGEPPFRPREADAIHIKAFVNAGRWLWSCYICNTAVICSNFTNWSLCPTCGVLEWVLIDYPANKAAIEQELLKQPGFRGHSPIRNWKPEWPFEQLQARTVKALEEQERLRPQSVRQLSIGSARTWIVGEILTAANMNTFISNVLDDVAGRDGPIQLEERLQLYSSAADPGTAVEDGQIYYNSASHKVRVRENGAWVDVDLTIPNASTLVRGITLLASDAEARLTIENSKAVTSRGVGLALDRRGIHGSDVQIFTASGTWTKPAGVAFIELFVWNGGSANRSSSGGCYYGIIPATIIPDSVSISVGAAGIFNPSTSAGKSYFGPDSITPYQTLSPSANTGYRPYGSEATDTDSVYGVGGQTSSNIGAAGGNPFFKGTNATRQNYIGGDGGLDGQPGTAPGGAGGLGADGSRGEVRIITHF